jgi:hypothetical protein
METRIREPWAASREKPRSRMEHNHCVQQKS